MSDEPISVPDMRNRLLFVISPPRAGSTLLQRMLGAHAEIYTHPEPHLVTPLAYLGYHDLVDKAPYDHINAAEAMRAFVGQLPRQEDDYLDALRAYASTLYGRMLQPSGRRYFLDKTPAYALVLPFLTRLFPNARYIALTRHPVAVMSSYANSFFDGDWQAAFEFNPIVPRYVPAIAEIIRSAPAHLHHVVYEQLVQAPAQALARIFAFLDLPDDPGAVSYGERTQATSGYGDPITVDKETRPVDSSIDKWIAEVAADEAKLELARTMIEQLDAHDVHAWGFDKATLLDPVEAARAAGGLPAFKKPRMNGYVFQRKLMLALKKDIDSRPHGKLIRRVRYYCNVLLR